MRSPASLKNLGGAANHAVQAFDGVGGHADAFAGLGHADDAAVGELGAEGLGFADVEQHVVGQAVELVGFALLEFGLLRQPQGQLSGLFHLQGGAFAAHTV
jgi:hypothetical protein